MRKLLIYLIVFISVSANAQNVGVGTASPAEKLDVNGNLNVNGQIKLNGNQGVAKQVLMKDASNNAVWGDISGFKNMVVFDCINIAINAGAANCINNWIVPAGVTEILVECWGGGGGGCSVTGGGGGGYASAKFLVTAGLNAALIIGAGGSYGNPATTGIIGGNTNVTMTGCNITAYGGNGGLFGDPSNGLYSSTAGGGFQLFPSINSIGFNGSPGGVTKVSFSQAGTTDFAKIFQYGNGGDAALLPGSGSQGGYRINSVNVNVTIYATGTAPLPGGGGGSDSGNGYYGKGGRIIIHY